MLLLFSDVFFELYRECGKGGIFFASACSLVKAVRPFFLNMLATVVKP